MLEITFKYKDAYTNGRWHEQTCIVSSVQECKEIYGLGIDCEYVIINVRRIG